MPTPTESITAYIHAKDSNRPHLLDAVFDANATVQMHVQTDAISFPSLLQGRDAIAETLVCRFNQTYENIYTLCVGEAPLASALTYSCDWFVVMSEKQSGAVRVGCGRYDWWFAVPDYTVKCLAITIVEMGNYSPDTLRSVMSLVSPLPYPWCGRHLAVQALVGSEPLRRVHDFLHRQVD